MDGFNEVRNTKNSLDVLIDMYNSELKYLTLMRHAFEIYEQPLRFIFIFYFFMIIRLKLVYRKVSIIRYPRDPALFLGNERLSKLECILKD